MGEAAEYFSKDFQWDDLRIRVENDPNLQYHLLPFEPSNSIPSVSPEADSNAWSRFHLRHSSGKFFKERRYLLKEFPELVSCKKYCKVLEVGCGNGSTVIPILRNLVDKYCLCLHCACLYEILFKNLIVEINSEVEKNQCQLEETFRTEE
ncbi:hypothetical protein IC582_011797 [Cucumis melo]